VTRHSLLPHGVSAGDRDQLTPRQIVRQLHAEIAATSPEHARLVAAFHALPEDRQRAVRAENAAEATS
jgi:hypothetical protein